MINAQGKPASGFTLLESLVAVFILATLTTAIAGVATLGTKTAIINEQRVVAQQIASEKAELLRVIPYPQIGYVSPSPCTGSVCEPDGIIERQETVTRNNGQEYTISTLIQIIDDLLNGEVVGQLTEEMADYKKVMITVTGPGASSVSARSSTSQITYIAVPQTDKCADDSECGIGKACCDTWCQVAGEDPSDLCSIAVNPSGTPTATVTPTTTPSAGVTPSVTASPGLVCDCPQMSETCLGTVGTRVSWSPEVPGDCSSQCVPTIETYVCGGGVTDTPTVTPTGSAEASVLPSPSVSVSPSLNPSPSLFPIFTVYTYSVQGFYPLLDDYNVSPRAYWVMSDLSIRGLGNPPMPPLPVTNVVGAQPWKNYHGGLLADKGNVYAGCYVKYIHGDHFPRKYVCQTGGEPKEFGSPVRALGIYRDELIVPQMGGWLYFYDNQLRSYSRRVSLPSVGIDSWITDIYVDEASSMAYVTTRNPSHSYRLNLDSEEDVRLPEPFGGTCPISGGEERMLAVAGSGSRLFAGTCKGLYVSENGGGTWDLREINTSVSGAVSVHDVAIFENYVVASYLSIPTIPSGRSSGLAVSDDGGQTFVISRFGSQEVHRQLNVVDLQ